MLFGEYVCKYCGTGYSFVFKVTAVLCVCGMIGYIGITGGYGGREAGRRYYVFFSLLIVCGMTVGYLRVNELTCERKEFFSNIRSGEKYHISGEIYEITEKEDKLVYYLKDVMIYGNVQTSKEPGDSIKGITRRDTEEKGDNQGKKLLYSSHEYRFLISSKEELAGFEIFKEETGEDTKIETGEDAKIETEKHKLTAKPGDRVSLDCVYYEFRIPTNEGEFDEKKYYFSEKILGRFVFESLGQKRGTETKNDETDIEEIYIKESDSFRKSAYYIREYLKSVLENICDSKTAGILKSVLLADKSELDNETKKLYQEVGIIHILVVSGLHISMLGMLIHRMCRKFFGRGISGIIASVAILSYVFIIQGQLSAKRAVIMFLCLILADIVGRSYDMVSAIVLAFGILVWDSPEAVFSSTILLSFGALLSIILISGNVLKFLNIKNRFFISFVSSECICAGLRPVLINIYYQCSVYSSVANMIIVPMMSLVLLLSCSGMLLGCVSTTIGEIFIYPVTYILDLFEFISKTILKIDSSIIITGHMKSSRVIIYYALVSGFVLLIYMWNKGHENVVSSVKTNGDDDNFTEEFWWIRLGKRGFVLVVYIVLWIVVLYNRPENSIKMLDVGQGDSILIQDDTGSAVMIDVGSSSKSNISKYTVLPMLKYNGIGKLDFLVITHSDADHINGAGELIEGLMPYGGVKYLVMPEVNAEYIDENYSQLVSLAQKCGIRVIYAKRGVYITLGDMRLDCIGPSEELLSNADNINDTSLVMKLKYGEFDALFTGDISETAERELVKNNGLNLLEVLKVAHHGSKYSTGKVFLESIKPKVSLISCGLKNRYGHPGKETIDRLNDIGSNIYITTECGQINVEINKNGSFEVKKFCG